MDAVDARISGLPVERSGGPPNGDGVLCVRERVILYWMIIYSFTCIHVCVFF